MEKYTTVITNTNEITKGEFDELKELHNLDVFTPELINMVALNVASLVKKGETSELSDDEQYIIKSGTAELKNLKEYTVNEMENGRIVKTKLFTQPRQVMWQDTLEKSITGDPIQKGIYLDTDLNRELERVGEEIIKGKRLPKKEEKDGLSDEERDNMLSSDMYKSMMDIVKKGEGADKKSLFKAVSEKYPDTDKEMVKKYMNHMYKSISKAYMEKASNYAEMSEKDEDEDEEETK